MCLAEQLISKQLVKPTADTYDKSPPKYNMMWAARMVDDGYKKKGLAELHFNRENNKGCIWVLPSIREQIMAIRAKNHSPEHEVKLEDDILREMPSSLTPAVKRLLEISEANEKNRNK